MKSALLFILAFAAMATSALTVTTNRLGSIKASEYVVTGVSGGGGGVTTNAVCDIVTNSVGGGAWVTNITATSGGKDVTLLNVAWGNADYPNQWIMELRVPGIGDAWRMSAAPNNVDPNAKTLAAMEYPELVTTRGMNALGLAYERDVRPTISNTVTAAYVEGLGISAGLSTNDVNALIASPAVTNAGAVAAAQAYADGAFLKTSGGTVNGRLTVGGDETVSIIAHKMVHSYETIRTDGYFECDYWWQYHVYGPTCETLPEYLASTAWHGTNKSLADYGITNDFATASALASATNGLARAEDVRTLKGALYDFGNGTNFTLRLYTALTNVIERMGGSVTNAPNFN